LSYHGENKSGIFSFATDQIFAKRTLRHSIECILVIHPLKQHVVWRKNGYFAKHYQFALELQFSSDIFIQLNVNVQTRLFDYFYCFESFAKKKLRQLG
jgi:hypothetical protein